MRRKKGQVNVNAFVLISIAAIIGIVILGVVFTFLRDEALNRKTTLAESVTIASAAGALTNTDDVLLVQFYNSSDILTVDVQVNATSAGVLTVDSLEVVDNTNYFANYTYDGPGYVDSGTTRTIIAIIPIIAALLLFVAISAFVITKK